MLSSVLRSEKAIAVNIEIMRTFSRLRRLLATHEELARQLSDLESSVDARFAVVFDTIREMAQPLSEAPKERIGFVTRKKDGQRASRAVSRLST
jgi:CHASE3 domain sensor protein